MRRTLSIFITAFLVLPQPAQCWWEEGHQVVARIAAQRLTPAALGRVAEVLEVEKTPEAVADALAAASVWADQVKAETNTGNWHFINLALQDGRDNISERCANDDCVTARIKLFAAQLKANDPDRESRFDEQDALRFLVHLVGDIHQPLHAISDADLGGNCELLNATVGEARNLHALWDGPMVGGGGGDKSLATDLAAEIAGSGGEDRSALADGDPDDWAWESHRLALLHIYKKFGIPKQEIQFPAACSQAPAEIQQFAIQVEESYVADMQSVVREQLKRGGMRLARVLNDALSGQQ